MQNPIRWKIRSPFNLRLNNLKKDVSNPKAIPACNHFKTHGHSFIRHTKFILKEQLREISNVSKDYGGNGGKYFRLLNPKHVLLRGCTKN